MDISPVVLFTYQRLDHLRQTIESLKANNYADLTDVYIYSDAAKTPQDVVHVNNVREYLRTLDGFKSVSIIEREYNWGLADNIIDGVTTVINRHGKVIVLEDDLVSSEYFLQFMNEALCRYQDEPKVMQISGYSHGIDKEGLESVFFLRLAYPWGWATWADRWKNFQRNTDKLIEKFTANDIYHFTLEGTYNDFWRQVLANHTMAIHTWWVFFYASVFQLGGLTLYPKSSCIKNIGCDGSGVHCGTNDFYDVHLAESPIDWPNVIIEENKLAMERYKLFYNQIIIRQMENQLLNRFAMRQMLDKIITESNHKSFKIVFFGTGSACSKICANFPYSIDYFVDNSQSKWEMTFKNRKILNPAQLMEEDKDKIMIIIASQYAEAISEQLRGMGFIENKHFWNGYLIYCS